MKYLIVIPSYLIVVNFVLIFIIYNIMKFSVWDEMKCVSHPGLRPHSETNGSICEFFKAIFQLNRKLQESS